MDGAPPTPILREPIGRADKVYDKQTRKWRLHKRSKPKDRSERFERFVIVTARVFRLQGGFSGQHEIYIRGRLLCEELNTAFGHDSSIHFVHNCELAENDLKTMYHALPKLEQRLNSLEQTEANSERHFELSAGVAFINEHWGHVTEELKATSEGQVKFEHLWTLFPPGCLVYGIDELDQDRIYRLRNCAYETKTDRSQIFTIEADYLDSNGDRLGYIQRDFSIKEFRSSLAVTELIVYPFELHLDFIEKQKRLLERADEALQLQGRHIQEYKGHAIMRESQHDSLPRKFNSHGRVVLDPILYDRVQPSNTLVPTIRRTVRRETLCDKDKILMNSMLYGFSLGDKLWGGFAISRLSNVVWNPSILESVVIEDEQKRFLRSLIKFHSSTSNAKTFDDIVRDKGKGLVGLFCGPPGVGKTLTAEAVAEVAERPLIALSSGEMGDDSVSVERRLNAELELAEAWNAVLLLDEADVFMTERDHHNLSQNAITSVFLRKLEYYQGILLLTTNRLESIDTAFESRIHFCFHYDELDNSARYSIWSTFLKKAGESREVQVHISDEEKRALAVRNLNGRQIKNIASVSRAFAMEEKVPLSLEVVQMAVNFTQFSSGTATPGPVQKKRKVK